MRQADSPRYARQRALPGFGAAAQEHLAAARVVVVGAGGLGSAVLPALAAAGVGTLVVVDDDTVEESNLHRQTIHGLRDRGRAKVASAADRIHDLTDHVTVLAERIRFDADSATSLVAGADVLVDASDNAAALAIADDVAAAAGIPLVWGSALGYGGQLGVVWDARGVRYRDLFPAVVDAPDSCETAGVLPTVCTVVGGLMATEVLKLLTGVGEPLLGALLDYDARRGAVRRLDFARDPRPASEEATPPAPRRIDELDPAALATELSSDDPPLLVDVRGSRDTHVELLARALRGEPEELPELLGATPRGRRIVAVCQRGVRSRLAVELLLDAGFTRPAHLAGGVEAWDRAAHPADRRG